MKEQLYELEKKIQEGVGAQPSRNSSQFGQYADMDLKDLRDKVMLSEIKVNDVMTKMNLLLRRKRKQSTNEQ